MDRIRSSPAAAVALLALAVQASSASAAPIVAAVAGPALGDETGIGGALGGRLGWRTAPAPARWGGFVELAAQRFLGFGPHTGTTGYHALLAGEWTRGRRALRAHVLAGGALDLWRRPGTEHDQEIDTTVLGAALGVGASWAHVRLDLVATFPLTERARAPDSPTVGPQLMLLVSVGRP